MADDPRPKRQVSYNPTAVLCPVCTKRIRLNNDGRVRIHAVGKMGSERCSGSEAVVAKDGKVLTNADIEALSIEAEAGYEASQLLQRNDSCLTSSATPNAT